MIVGLFDSPMNSLRRLVNRAPFVLKARGSVSPFKEMPDDRDHRDDEEDVNKPTSHREYKEPQCPEND
jgi:hypothetical protein